MNIFKIEQVIQKIWISHKFCTCELCPPHLTLKQGVRNLCYACCLIEVDICVK